MVGTALSASRQEASQLVDRILWALTERHGGLAFDATHFGEEFDGLVADLERTEEELPIIVPLLGVSGDGFPIALTPNLEIDHLADHEISWCLATGLIPTLGMGDFAAAGQEIGIRTKVQLPRLTSAAISEGESEAAWSLERAAVAATTEPVEALRVFKPGRFSVPGYVRLMDVRGRGGAAFGPVEGVGGRGKWGGDYHLTETETDSFVAFWREFEKAKQRKLVDGALRRFSYASDRDRPDDRLVDLVIAGETLFLGDSGKAQERGELRYRYSLRAAFHLDLLGSRTDVFRFMRNGYDARSAIVHGGTPDAKILKGIDGAALTLDEFAGATEAHCGLLSKRRSPKVRAHAGHLLTGISSSWTVARNSDGPCL